MSESWCSWKSPLVG